MSRICAICDKHPRVKNLVSHAKNKTKKWVYPNVNKMRFVRVSTMFKKKVNVERAAVCTKCVKAGKIKKII